MKPLPNTIYKTKLKMDPCPLAPRQAFGFFAFLFLRGGLDSSLLYNVTNLHPYFIRHSVYQIQSLKSFLGYQDSEEDGFARFSRCTWSHSIRVTGQIWMCPHLEVGNKQNHFERSASGKLQISILVSLVSYGPQHDAVASYLHMQ